MEAPSEKYPSCRRRECKCTTLLELDAWEIPRDERLCEDCEHGEHAEDPQRW